MRNREIHGMKGRKTDLSRKSPESGDKSEDESENESDSESSERWLVKNEDIFFCRGWWYELGDEDGETISCTKGFGGEVGEKAGGFFEER